jgi:hypothetical protein
MLMEEDRVKHSAHIRSRTIGHKQRASDSGNCEVTAGKGSLLASLKGLELEEQGTQ